jgi:hypothetical protein
MSDSRLIFAANHHIGYRLTTQQHFEDGKYQSPEQNICRKKSRSHLTSGARRDRSAEAAILQIELNNAATISHNPLMHETRSSGPQAAVVVVLDS